MTSERQNRYFAASNSAEGFVNYFPQIFGRDQCRRLYVIKGGPGTGKSCFMRQVAQAAQERGYEATYYFCSSDPDSLDGILIGELGVGFVDGTAPHVWEPTSIGAFEQILNLGVFWNEDVLALHREEIEALYKKKKESYQEAYDYLSSYGKVMRALGHRAEQAVDREKMSHAAERLIKRLAPSGGRGYFEEVAICDSVGMSGRVRFDTYERTAKILYAVKDCCGTSHLFFDALLAHCRRQGIGVRVSRHPILPERIDALTLIDCGVTFVTEETAAENVVNMRRFVRETEHKTLRAHIKSRNALAEALLACAEESFKQVRRHHFAVEALFNQTMDFSAKESFTVAFCTKLFAEA